MSCEPPLRLELASPDERLPAPAFRVSDPERPSERPRYATLQVLNERGDVLWFLRAEPYSDEHGVARLVYGTEPEGFATVVPAQRLGEGRTYRAEVSGEGRGTLRFKVEPGGRIRPE